MHPNDKALKSQNIVKNIISLKSNPELDNLNAIFYEQMKAEEVKALEHILWPWLPVQGISFVYAASGVGKTLFTMNVAYAIAAGGKFLRYHAPKPRKVLYIDGEMAYTQVLARFHEIIKQQGELDFPENWSLFTPDKFLPHQLPKICSPEGQQFYNQYFEREKIEVVVFDNLSMLSAIDENKSEEWKVVQDWLLNLRAKGMSVIMVHHSSKDKNGYRGTSRMLDCADSAISLQSLDGDQLESEQADSRKFKIDYQKARSFGGREAFPFEVSVSASGWAFQSMENTNICKVAELLNMGLSQSEISRELLVSRQYIGKVVGKARRMGLVKDKSD